MVTWYRCRLLKYETLHVLGNRAPSTYKSSAFGARYYQPHMTLLKPGSGVGPDLTVVGDAFRRSLGDLTFDKFTIGVTAKTQPATPHANGSLERGHQSNRS